MDVFKFWIIIIVVFAILESRLYSCTPIDNGVVGEPTITCGSEEIQFWVQTEKPFEGKVYVKGEYGKPECSSSGGQGSSVGPTKGPTDAVQYTTISSLKPAECPPCPTCAPTKIPDSFSNGGSYLNSQNSGRNPRQSDNANHTTGATSAHLKLAIGTCNMKRERSLNPQGVSMSVTIVISFHQIFITKVDRAYQVRCFYMEADKTVTSVIDVSMPQTTELSGQAIMPICTYTIHRGTADGPEIKFAKVGDPVFHKWMCKSENPEMFGMLVHSCTVEDGQGKKINVINDKGCTLDKYVIGDLNYHTSLLLATVESHVFKFADRTALDFQCAINICVKADKGCEGITPPRCDRVNKRNVFNVYSNKTLDENFNSNDWNIHANRLTVVDIDDNIQSEELALLEEKSNFKKGSSPISEKQISSDNNSNVNFEKYKTPNLCLSVVGFGLFVALCTFVFTLAAVILGYLYVIRSFAICGAFNQQWAGPTSPIMNVRQRENLANLSSQSTSALSGPLSTSSASSTVGSDRSIYLFRSTDNLQL